MSVKARATATTSRSLSSSTATVPPLSSQSDTATVTPPSASNQTAGASSAAARTTTTSILASYNPFVTPKPATDKPKPATATAAAMAAAAATTANTTAGQSATTTTVTAAPPTVITSTATTHDEVQATLTDAIALMAVNNPLPPSAPPHTAVYANSSSSSSSSSHSPSSTRTAALPPLVASRHAFTGGVTDEEEDDDFRTEIEFEKQYQARKEREERQARRDKAAAVKRGHDPFHNDQVAIGSEDERSLNRNSNTNNNNTNSSLVASQQVQLRDQELARAVREQVLQQVRNENQTAIQIALQNQAREMYAQFERMRSEMQIQHNAQLHDMATTYQQQAAESMRIAKLEHDKVVMGVVDSYTAADAAVKVKVKDESTSRLAAAEAAYEAAAAAITTRADKPMKKESKSQSQNTKTKKESQSTLTNAANETNRLFKGESDDDGDGNDDPGDDDPDDDDVSVLTPEKNNPYQYLMPFFLARETLYPFHKHASKYKGRYSLLTARGRRLEHYRFGLMVDFPTSLYTADHLRRYERIRADNDLPLSVLNRTPRPITDDKLPQMIMTFDKRDVTANQTYDFDLPAINYTLIDLPAELRVHPPGHDGVYPKLSFTDICMTKVNKDLEAKESNRRVALNSLAARYAASVKGETIPMLERPDGVAATPISTYSQLNQSSFNLTARDQFAINEQHRLKGDEERRATKQSALGDILELLPIDLRAQTVARINSANDGDDTNCFTDKSKLKGTMVTMDKKFDGVAKNAGVFLNFIITNTAEFNFTVSEFITLIGKNVTDHAYTWWQSNLTTINAQPTSARPRKFLELFRSEFLTQSHINEYEAQLLACQLRTVSIEAIDAHYKKYTELLLNLRLCKPHLSEKEVIHSYYRSLTDAARAFVTVQEMMSYESLLIYIDQFVNQLAMLVHLPLITNPLLLLVKSQLMHLMQQKV